MSIFIVSIIPFLIFSYLKTRKSFHMLQQNLYNDDNRYLKWTFNNITKIILDTDILFLILICPIFLDSTVSAAIFATLYLIIILLYLKKKTKFVAKKPLVVTARVKRLFTTITILYLIAIIPFVVCYDKNMLAYELILYM